MLIKLASVLAALVFTLSAPVPIAIDPPAETEAQDAPPASTLDPRIASPDTTPAECQIPPPWGSVEVAEKCAQYWAVPEKWLDGCVIHAGDHPAMFWVCQGMLTSYPGP